MQSIARMSKMVIVIYIVVEPFLFLIILCGFCQNVSEKDKVLWISIFS